MLLDGIQHCIPLKMREFRSTKLSQSCKEKLKKANYLILNGMLATELAAHKISMRTVQTPVINVSDSDLSITFENIIDLVFYQSEGTHF